MATNNLFGTGPKQVPQNVNLGGMAYQNPDYVKIKNLEVDYISHIESQIPESAVDIFIYDTSKDSDGGAWRKRTQHTSWYNETLNTATRGSRREFPAVAVIVAESDTVTIYDGDDPDLPMWMVFNQSSSSNSTMLGANAKIITSCSIKNGILCVTIYNSGWGISEIRFVDDSQRWIWGGYDYPDHKQISNSIAERNVESSWVGPGSGGGGIVSGYANDVAMTVLPNAPIDDATGLPIPTIAVATDSGASIIKDNGTVLDLTQNHANANHVNFVDFDSKTNAIIWTTDYQPEGTAEDAYKLNVNPIPNSDLVTGNGIIGPYQNWNRTIQTGGNLTKPKLKGHPMTGVISNGGDGCYAISTGNSYNGNTLNLLKEYYGSVPGSTTNVNALIAYVGHDYNTGWMRGEARAAWLSDTDTTDAIEYVQNGYFNNDVSSWTIGTTGTTATLDANRLLLTAPTSGASWGYVYQGITTEIGKTYKISLYYDRGTVDGRIVVRNDSTNTTSGALFYYDLGTGDDAKTYWNTFTATATTTYILLYSKSTSGGTNAYDQISVTLEKDRSDKNRGLNVFGTVTKSPVAPGSELVAYSGFTSSNYLQQPYNSDLDFAADDFSISFWYKSTTTVAACVLHRGDGGINPGWGTGKIIQIEFNTTNLAAFLAESGFSGFDTVVIPQAKAADGNWHHYMLVRSNEFVGVYWDGILQDETRSSRNLSNTAARTWVGERPNNTRPLVDTSLTLLRMTAHAPTEEQIKYMYQSEKMLFTDNSNCTLYGTSDEVTAMAHDEGTGVLHVGTSGGRSDFQGLCRINNTTTAVTTAISAHDGFIVEQ